MLKITVITVCYNAETTIRKTMESVLAQNKVDIEYLVIDGTSKDNTVHIAEEIRKANSDRDIQIYSEKDFGIYNAMNRGIVRATGDYVIFLNSGDAFCNAKVLRQAVYHIDQKGYGIYYGIAYKTCNQKVIGTIDFGSDKRTDLTKLLNAFAPNHQSTLAPLSCLKRFYFDEEYEYCADIDWLIKCYKAGIRLINMDYPVCYFDTSGASHRAKAVAKGREDIYKMLKKQYPILGRMAVSLMELR